MKGNLNEQVFRIKTMMGLNEQVDPETAASGPQKCAATDARDRQNRKDNRADRIANAALDAEVAKQSKIDAADNERRNKNFLSLKYDRDSYPLDKDSRKEYYTQYANFMKSNPSDLTNGDGLNTEQKYAVISKVLDFVRRVPQISYTVQLGRKYGLNKQSTLNDVINVVEKMGGWQSMVGWLNSGGQPELK